MKIGDEIVYESASGTSINITERGIDGTTAKIIWQELKSSSMNSEVFL